MIWMLIVLFDCAPDGCHSSKMLGEFRDEAACHLALREQRKKDKKLRGACFRTKAFGHRQHR